MSNSVHDIIAVINSSLSGKIKGKWQGVANTVRRNNIAQPEIGEKFAGFDDRHELLVYHKLGTLTSRIAPNTGIGRSVGNIANTYQNSMVVFVNYKHCGLYPDEVFLQIQELLPEQLGSDRFEAIRLAIGSVQLDSELTFNQEYTNTPYRLKTDQYLFRINYTIETTFKKGCFAPCK